ncbi:hypothetical protein [Flagellimonas baculiformis]|uniref:hypothetical protein n=1 Tax=Flagellimonas baculiformis TaxID=3067310 RepID=UPI00296E79FA|nr:hypothetical protein [Muricauda sp. D6]
MTQIHTSLARKSLWAILFLLPSVILSQRDGSALHRLDQFMRESSITTYREVSPDSTAQVLKYAVYHITQETKNLYSNKDTDINRLIVIDTGEKVNSFEQIHGDTDLPEFQSYIREDFKLTDQTALYFQGVLDVTYPLPSWKPDKREFFFAHGKWYFLRDAYFRTKQGFEVTVDAEGKILSICYKMKWDESESR